MRTTEKFTLIGQHNGLSPLTDEIIKDTEPWGTQWQVALATQEVNFSVLAKRLLNENKKSITFSFHTDCCLKPSDTAFDDHCVCDEIKLKGIVYPKELSQELSLRYRGLDSEFFSSFSDLVVSAPYLDNIVLNGYRFETFEGEYLTTGLVFPWVKG